MRSVKQFARDMAALHVSHWRNARSKGLPKSAAHARSQALFWFAAARGAK